VFKLWQSFVDQVKADVRRSIVAVRACRTVSRQLDRFPSHFLFR
jgi:hypothetical protein